MNRKMQIAEHALLRARRRAAHLRVAGQTPVPGVPEGVGVRGTLQTEQAATCADVQWATPLGGVHDVPKLA
jgi:hypothetical protein